MVQSILDIDGLLTRRNLLTLNFGSGNGLQTFLLLNLALRLVLGEETEYLGGSILIQGAVELVDRRWDLQALLQDGALALQTDIQRPLDVASQVALGLDIITDGKVARALLEEAISGLNGLLRLASQWSWSGCLALGGLNTMVNGWIIRGWHTI